MAEEKREDTLVTLLNTSRRALAEVSMKLERGRIRTSHAEHAINVKGCWSVGTIFKSDDLEIYLYVAFASTSNVPETLCHKQRAFYLGKSGKANIHRGKTGYTRISESVIATLDPGEQHSLEPVEVGTQLLVVLLGIGERNVDQR